MVLGLIESAWGETAGPGAEISAARLDTARSCRRRCRCAAGIGVVRKRPISKINVANRAQYNIIIASAPALRIVK